MWGLWVIFVAIFVIVSIAVSGIRYDNNQRAKAWHEEFMSIHCDFCGQNSIIEKKHARMVVSKLSAEELAEVTLLCACEYVFSAAIYEDNSSPPLDDIRKLNKYRGSRRSGCDAELGGKFTSHPYIIQLAETKYRMAREDADGRGKLLEAANGTTQLRKVGEDL